MIELREAAHYVSDKIDVSSLKKEEYITTDNMIPNRGGVVDCENLPQASRVTKYEPGDVLVSNIRPYFKKIWFSDRISGCSNDVIVFRTNDENWNKKFLYYVLSQDSFFDFMMAGSNGTKMPRGNKKTIPEFLIPNFDIDKQIRVADILSAYDNLVENNQKQIKLLEEAAQRLYKEWFVDLHFPGYENVEIVDGVPKGWGIAPIIKVANLKAGGDKPKTFSEKMTNENKIPVIANGITRKGLMGFTDKAVINNPSVTISARGTVGVVFLRTEPYVPIVRLISVTPIEDKIDILYLYLYLINQNFRSTGAAQQQITVPLLKSKNIVCPTDDVRKSFNDVIAPIFNKIEILEKHINKLTESRDRLLPKLMSGEIEV